MGSFVNVFLCVCVCVFIQSFVLAVRSFFQCPLESQVKQAFVLVLGCLFNVVGIVWQSLFKHYFVLVLVVLSMLLGIAV